MDKTATWAEIPLSESLEMAGYLLTKGYEAFEVMEFQEPGRDPHETYLIRCATKMAIIEGNRK